MPCAKTKAKMVVESPQAGKNPEFFQKKWEKYEKRTCNPEQDLLEYPSVAQ